MDVEVFRFQKNRQETVRVSLIEFRGETYLSLRVWWQPSDWGEEAMPTRKGLTLSVQNFDDLERAVLALRRGLKAQGLL